MPNENTLLDKAKYVLNDFSNQRPFSSFLPGIAGPTGIPLWVFYVNRGQAIASFGLESKDHPILEFQPANKAYRETPITGFRTFIKILSEEHNRVYEPFSAYPPTAKVGRQMCIGMNELEIHERNPELGLQTEIVYFILPGERFAGLVRRVTLTNITERTLDLEILDGLPAMAPFGVNNSTLKEIGRTIEAWMAVYNLEQGVPLYRLRASTEDTAEVEAIEAGHFALSFSTQGAKSIALPPVVDPELVFGHNTALTAPVHFSERPLEQLLAERQITDGKTPCGFFGLSTSLSPSKSTIIHSVFGHLGNERHLAELVEKLRNAAFLDQKRRQANQLTMELSEAIATKTGSPVFDAYCRQTYLDNLLRGGWPILLGDKNAPAVYHIYSRKHGDLERDYNTFRVAPEPFSQGEVNYRDVNQNRRCDVLFNPQVGDFNIRAFLSLIQADGYNPLVIQGVKFRLSQEKWEEIQNQVGGPNQISLVLTRPFTPGELLRHLCDHDITLKVSPEDFLASTLQHAEHHFEASHGEGYWVDHWTYNLDLIDSYLTVFPDRLDELLFGSEDIPFYDSPVIVRPRAKKYVLAAGVPRQFGAVAEDPEKTALIASRKTLPNWARRQHGQGAIYHTTPFAKLVILALIKFATMDPYGMGIEMEAGKPGWYDAVNGLPGLFGASMPETFALQRLLSFLESASRGQTRRVIKLPIEVWALMSATMACLRNYNDSVSPDRDFKYWEAVSGAREHYRAAVRLGFDGREHSLKLGEIAQILSKLLEKVQRGAQRASEYTDGVPATYFAFRVEEYETIQGSEGEIIRDEVGRPSLRARRFTPVPLPVFLEGPVRALGVQSDRSSARILYQQVKASPLFDRKLKMYKVNASLADQPHDIGRARAFTPGWLENESIWLHMEYKYLLELLKAGLYEEFFEDFKNALIPFQDPGRYGRSPMENSSFLVSSAHPDESLHGAGFVARLTGATAEFLSIWNLMMVGARPFYVHDDKLHFRLQPALPGWLFTPENTVSFRLLGRCDVTYHMRSGEHLLPAYEPTRITLTMKDDNQHTIEGAVIPPPFAEQLRNGGLVSIEQFYE